VTLTRRGKLFVANVKEIRIGDHWVTLWPSKIRGGKFLGDLKDWYISCDSGGFPILWEDEYRPLTRDERMDVVERLCSQCKFRGGGCPIYWKLSSNLFPLEECTDEGYVKPQYRCFVCGKWFDSLDELERHRHCRVCGKLFDLHDLVKHHLNYAKDKTVLVCRSCHAKIHHSSRYPHLKPVDSKPKPRRKFKYVPCSLCGHKTRVPVDAPDKSALCSECRKKQEEKQRRDLILLLRNPYWLA